jgi:hypothetical protein
VPLPVDVAFELVLDNRDPCGGRLNVWNGNLVPREMQTGSRCKRGKRAGQRLGNSSELVLRRRTKEIARSLFE